MKKYFLTLFLSFSLALAYSQESGKNYREAFQLIEVWLEAQKEFDQLPGISAIVMRDQEVLWSGAAGMANVGKDIKMDVSTLGSICSISKLFTAVAIMELYDEGKLRLDDRISDLLPSYKLQQRFPDSGPITIRSILTHSSGIPRDADYPYWTEPDFSFPGRVQFDSTLARQETLYPASTYYQYSNAGFTLLGEVIEEVSGIPYNKYIQQNILTPLGLTNTRTYMPEDLYGNELAIGYSSICRNGNREKVNFFEAKGVTSAAGLTSNVQDMGKFASWQLRLRDTTASEILDPSTLRYMQTVQWTDPDWSVTRGLGFSVYKGQNGHTWVGHGGNCPGYRSSLQIDLENKLSYAVMINANGTNPNKYIQGIYSIVRKMDQSKQEKVPENNNNLGEYTGYYSLQPWWSEQYLTTWNGKLVTLALPSDNPGNSLTFFKHIKGDVFRRIRDNGELAEAIEFQRSHDGHVISFKRNGNYSKRLYR